MAYKVQRAKKIIEELELVDESGVITERIQVQLDADDMVRKVSEKYLDLIHIQKEISTMTQDQEKALPMLQDAVMSLFEAIFGVDNTQKILAFYDGNYIEMIRQVLPFIADVVIPNMRKLSQQRRQLYSRKS